VVSEEGNSQKSKLRLRGPVEFADLWRNAGRRYRLWLLMMLLGLLLFIPLSVAGIMIVTHHHAGSFGWGSLICLGIGLILIIIGNLMRFREIGRYRVRTGTLSFNPYLHNGIS
jgi:hypothetical protein